MRKLPPKYLIAALIIAAVAAAAGLYHRYGSNTRVAFVNYPEYLLAPLMNQELNPAIEATPLRWTETSGEELKNAISEKIKAKDAKKSLVGNMVSEGTTPRNLTDLIGSLCDLTSGSGDKGTPIIYIQGYFDNYTNE